MPMPPFQLALINPNTDESDTAEMAAAATAALGDGAEVVALTARRGVAGIETSAESVIAAAETLELVRDTPDADAYLIACFGDPGLDGVRELTNAPVVGIGEATYRAMTSVARRFAVITTLRRGIPELLDGLEHYGVAGRCVGVLASEITVEDLGGDSTDAIVAAGRRAVDELGAEALALACGGMTELETAVRERVGVPATNGVAFGALLAHALWRSGLRTSTVGSLALPPSMDPAALRRS
jgi:allantoin racemase